MFMFLTLISSFFFQFEKDNYIHLSGIRPSFFEAIPKSQGFAGQPEAELKAIHFSEYFCKSCDCVWHV